MSGFVKKMFIAAMAFFSCGALKRVSMSDQERRVIPAVINFNINEPVFYP